MSHIDALVVGAGPTGLMMAAELARHGVRCRIIDKNEGPSQRSKALVVQVRSVEIFDDIGIADDAIAASQKIRGASFSMDGREPIFLDLQRSLDVDSPYPFPLILEQSKTEAILLAHLEKFDIDVERGAELKQFSEGDDGVRATLLSEKGEEEISCDWLLGCDGAHSTVRRTLGIPFTGSKYEEEFVLADVDLEWSLSRDRLRGFISKKGLIAAIPMYGGERYRIIAVRRGYHGREGEDPTLEEVQTFVDEMIPEPAKVTNPRWISNFVIHCRGVSKYRVGRAFLAGDAAHIHSPAGGQGMNTGLQDAYNLAWKLALVIRGKAHPEILDSYHAERHPVGEFLLKNTDRLFRTMVKSGLPIRLFRGYIGPLLLKLFPALRRRAARVVSQLGIHYKSSPLVAEHSSGPRGEVPFSKGPHAGERAPDARFHGDDGEKTLFQLLRGPHHTLLLCSGIEATPEDVEALAEISASIDARYAEEIRVHFVVAGDEKLGWQGSLLYDREHRFHRRYAASSAALYLIRPDGYIGFRSQPPKKGVLEEYLGKIFR